MAKVVAVTTQSKANASRLTRRHFLTTTAVAAGSFASRRVFAADIEPALSFIVVGDTHYLASNESPEQLDAKSAEVCGRLVDTLNRLPGSEIPTNARGGRVARPSGVIHAGDVIDTGDKGGGVTGRMQQTEWAGYEADYGLNGKDGRLKFPVYEIHGNHDAPHGEGLALKRIAARNPRRPGVTNISPNGLHYSWDWGRVHFINLGLIVGTVKSVTRKRRYAALDSFDFLVSDLRDKVGTSGRPVIITHHVDVARYTGACDPAAPPTTQEWDPCDVHAFYEALKGFNIAPIFYGHTHVRNVFKWDGVSTRSPNGLAVFNTDNASHFNSETQAFFYVELRGGELLVREYQTKDRWATGFWTPMVWTAPVRA